MTVKNAPAVIVPGILTAFSVFVELYCFITKVSAVGIKDNRPLSHEIII